MTGKKWIFLERNTLHRVWAISEGEERALKLGVISFYGEKANLLSTVFSIANNKLGLVKKSSCSFFIS